MSVTVPVQVIAPFVRVAPWLSPAQRAKSTSEGNVSVRATPSAGPPVLLITTV